LTFTVLVLLPVILPPIAADCVELVVR